MLQRLSFLALALSLASPPTLAAAAPDCREAVKQGRSGGFISFNSEAHARELLDAESRRFCRGLGAATITEVRCKYDAPRKQSVVDKPGDKPLVLERRERWYCSGDIACALPEKQCGPAPAAK